MDLNTATREDLMTIPGIGRAISRNIVEVRRERLLLNVQQARDPVKGEEGIDRAFESVDDLKFVKGIGPTKLEKLRPFLTVTPSQTLCIRSQVQQHAGILCLATWNVRNLSMKTSRGPPLPMNETKSSCQCNPSKSVATAPASTSTQDMSASAPAKAKRDLSVVAGIIQKYDVVAIQEIRDEKVAGEICRLLDGYDYILSSPVGDMLQSHREYFCYFYLKTLGLTPQVLAVPSTDNKTMVRGPFMVKFEAPSMASFVLVNVHVVYGRVEEGASAEFKEKSRRHDDIGVLNSILTSLAAIYQGPVMVLGDFNLPPFFIDEIGPRFLNFRPVLGSNHVTTIGNNLFDNIWLPQCSI
ncbi:hypothetical protein DYB32_006816 [Aphanomyces invadans]|uniref:Endonuclease/exonuclease/phosphatase family domain-containing protein 1 n=1 Tax=Aphanomyces invadans TaxID=157072 RepID=A0A3R6YW18_9STRA|nr:hypothetical protein DYB32_006816 [Aphanomyces invadans]